MPVMLAMHVVAGKSITANLAHMIAAVVAAHRRHVVAVAAVAATTAFPAATSAAMIAAMTDELDHAGSAACGALQVKHRRSLCGQPDCRQQDQTARQSSGRCQVGFH